MMCMDMQYLTRKKRDKIPPLFSHSDSHIAR